MEAKEVVACFFDCWKHKGGKHFLSIFLAASRCGRKGEAWREAQWIRPRMSLLRIPSSPLGNPLGFFQKKRSGIFSCGVCKICILWHIYIYINRLRYSSIFRCATVGLAKWLAEYLWPTLPPPSYPGKSPRIWRRLPIVAAWNSKLQPTPLR